MLASQLLRILESIPNDEKNENGVADPAEQDTAMKEDQHTTLSDAKNLETKADRLSLGSKEVNLLNDSEDSSPLAFEVKDGGVQRWNPFLDDFSDNENVNRDSPRMEQQNGLSYEVGDQEKDADSSSSESNDKPKIPEHEISVILKEFTHFNEKEHDDSILPPGTPSDLHESEMNLFTDKSVLECELPELMVCYKDANHHIVKDISVDEGIPVKDNISIESCKDDQSDRSFPKLPDDNNHVTEGDFFISDGIAASVLENAKGIDEDGWRNKEERHGNVVAQEGPKSPLENSLQKNIAKNSNVVESVQQKSDNLEATDNTVTKTSKENSFVDRRLPIQEFGTRSFLRSFMNSLDFEENKLAPISEQIPSGQAYSGSLAASSAEAVPKDDVPKRRLYKSKVENESITFNFNSPPPAVVGIKAGSTEEVLEQSVDSRDVHDRGTSNHENSIGSSSEQSMNMKEKQFNDFSSTNQAQYIINDDRDKNINVRTPVLKDGNSDDLSAYLSESDSPNSINSDEQAIKPNVLQHERRNSDNVSVASQLRDDVGESSFSAAGGLIIFSEPIPANISLRSDGSTTSGRSFAFPELQTEWSSSPVRMVKADGKQFQKHKGWRSGLFCCRF